jgi:hypothetical protein
MRALISLLFGALVAIGATLLHATKPPFGVILALVATYLAIRWIGRYFGKKRYKLFALFGWFFVIIRAGSFGVGQELLIQGDNSGAALVFLGFIIGIIAVVQRA